MLNENLFKKIYKGTPFWLQDEIAKAYAKYILPLTYGGGNEFRDYFKALNKSEFYPLEKLERLQEEKLRRLIKHAVNNVPYYKDLFEREKLTIDDIQTKEDLQKLPILTKEEIRKNYDKMIIKSGDLSKLTLVATGGSTGTPMKFYMDNHSMAVRFATWARWKKFAGVEAGRDRFVYMGMVILPDGDDGSKFYGKFNWYYNQLKLAAFNLSDEVLSRYVDNIRKFKPVYIQGYASAIYVLALFLKEGNISGIKVKAVLTSSDTLFDYQRKVIEDVFGCKAFNHYGQNEDIVTGTECEYHNGFHLNMENGITEIVDERGTRLESGAGRIIGTQLENYSMPLIRYDIGDLGRISPEQCRCGRNLILLKEFIGRQDDIIVTPEGRRVGCGGMNQPMKYLFNAVKECQYIQKSVSRLVVKVVPTEKYGKEDEKKFIETIKKQIGNSMEIKIEIVNEIPRTSSGKFKFIISEVSKSN